MIHPHLWPALIGALLGLPLVILGAIWLLKRWAKLSRPARWSLLAALALLETAYWLNLYAWFVEPNRLHVRRVEIVSENWRGPALTIAAIGDLHVAGPHMRPARVSAIVARVNALRPDLIVLLGDYVGGHAPLAERGARERAEISDGLSRLAALDARYGKVAVLGNHDSWYDRATVNAALQNAGIAALWNRHVVIARAAGRFTLAGLADVYTGDPDYAAALDGAPEDIPLIVLTHNPDVFVGLPARPALTLAAHTHCGQVSLPFVGRLIIPSDYGQRFACGRIEEEGRRMFVTGGLGTSILPVRFFNPPEIALITLRAPD